MRRRLLARGTGLILTALASAALGAAGCSSSTQDSDRGVASTPQPGSASAVELCACDDFTPLVSDASSCNVQEALQRASISLRGCDLSGVNLQGAALGGADLSDTTLARADLSGAELIEANLRRTRAPGADLREIHGARADLTGADLMNADLSDADLSDANLAGANLVDARLIGADLEGAYLDGADVTGVDWGATICPDGTNSDDNGGTCEGHLGS